MEIKVKKVVEGTVEVKLPYYFKTSAHLVGLISDEKGIQIADCLGTVGIRIDTAEKTFSSFDWCNEKIEITAEEFHAKMLEVLNNLTVDLHNVGGQIKNQFIETVSKTDLEGE